MRTSTAAWTAALAVMSVHGPFTTAEAAPARTPDEERPKYFFPKEVKRERAYTNSTVTAPPPAEESPASSTDLAEIPQAPASDEAPVPSFSEPAAPVSEPAPSSGSLDWIPNFDPSAWLAGMLGKGELPQTEDAVMTSVLTTTYQNPFPRTQTYTVTWTQTAASAPSSSSLAALTTSSSIPAPSSSLPSVIVEPTSSSSSSSIEVEPTTTSTTPPSVYSPETVIEPTPPSSTEIPPPPPSTTTTTSPSAYAPPTVVEPTPPTTPEQESPSAFSPTEIVQPTSRKSSRKHSPTDAEEEPTTRTRTRTRWWQSGDSPSFHEPETVVEPTPYTPKTTATSPPPESPSSFDEATTYSTVEPSSSSYAVISSRSARWGLNTSTPFLPTAISSSSSSSVEPSSSSTSTDEEFGFGFPFGTSLGLPTSILQPSQKLHSSTATEVDSLSRHHRGRPGRPTDGTRDGVPETVVPPTPKSSDSEDETTTRTRASSGELPTSIVLPTPHSSKTREQGDEHTEHRGEHTRHGGEHPHQIGGQDRPTGWPFNEPLPTGLLPSLGSEPTPTPRTTSTASNASASSNTSAPIIVGLSTIIESSLPSQSSDDSSTAQPTRPSGDNPFESLGLTGLPTSFGQLAPTSGSASGSSSGDDEEGGFGAGHGQGPHGQGTGRPDFDPFSELGITGLPTSLGQPTGIIPTDIPTSTGANDSNTDKPDGGPVRPPGLGMTGATTDQLTLPTSLPLQPTGNDTAILPVPLPTGDFSDGESDTRTSETGLGGVIPTGGSPVTSPPLSGAITSVLSEATDGLGSVLTTDTNSALSGAITSAVSEITGGVGGILTTDTDSALSGSITSAVSEITGGVGGILTDTGAAPTPSEDSLVTTATPSPLESIASSLSDELSSITATATDPAVASSLESELTSKLSSAASSLVSEGSLTLDTPEATSTPLLPTAAGTLIPTSAATSADSAGTTIGTPAPTPGADQTTPSYTLSTSTGSDGTTAIPVPNTQVTDTPTTEQISSSADTPSETYESETGVSGGSTINTSIPLSTGATIPITSGTATLPSGTGVSPSDVPASQSPSISSGESDTSTDVPVVPVPTTTDGSETTAQTIGQDMPPTSPASTAQTTPPPSPSSETSIEPTGTNTDTDYTLPTSWHFAPTGTTTTAESSGTLTVAPSSTEESAPGLPTYMPRLIQPPGGMPSAPSNATLIQLGLNYGLNFPFVVREQDSASQIFAYLPQGIAYGLGISSDKVKMNALMPYDTSKSLSYITTLAQAYVPADMVDQLSLDLHTPMSNIYSNPDDMIRTLMDMINPTIPILPGASMDPEGSSSADNPGATGGPPGGEGAPIGGDTGTSHTVRGSSVGIGVGAVCGAAAYAAAMVYVARRYKKKRAGHQRASSVPTAGEMSEAPNAGGGMGNFFMSGGRGSSAAGSGSRNSGHSSNGRSVREQGISAPVMSENSLGWN